MHPPPIPPPSPIQPGLPDRDEEHLRQLAIFHYIYAGFEAVTSLVGLIFVGLGIAMAVRPDLFEGPNPPPPFVGGIFAGIGGFVFILILGSAVCTMFAGRYLKQRRHHTFCLVMACLNCMSMPFGTILGVFTIMVITRPRVQAMFV